MGSFVFRWEHPAKEVFVTGTFDDWGKSVKLDHKNGVFEKDVQLPETGEKIYYKFVVDGNWTTDHTAPQENDGQFNLNNVLLPENIKKPTMSGVTPSSTTSALAAGVPKESSREAEPATSNGVNSSSSMPGDFPETPANEASDFSVNPIPATSGIGNPVKLAPEEKVPEPSTLTSNTISSTAHDDPSLAKSADDSEKTFGVAPLPATGGVSNPISLEPGEKVPHPSEYTSNTINSHVTTDKESYEKAGSGAPQLDSPVTPQVEREKRGAGLFGLPADTGNLIPESSLPMGSSAETERDPGVTIQSAAPTSTTATLAANVPLEPRGAASEVPEVVKDSQEEANAAPEASGSAAAVSEKAEVEQELKKEVSPEPPTSEGTAGEPSTNGLTTGIAGAAAGGAAAAATAVSAAKDTLPASITNSISAINSSADKTATDVPEVVQESISAANQSPEAAGNKEAVVEKKAVETELLKDVKPEESTGEPAPTASAALTESAPAPTAASTTSAAPTSAKTEGLAGSAASPAQTPITKEAETKAAAPVDASAPTESQPSVTTGVGASKTPAVSKPTAETKAPQTPEKAEPSSESPRPSTSATEKKKKRTSIFGKLKEKFSHEKK
ncbi:MAG: hypothetical protein M1819_004725 [Sarea resinae]|nr:MAG: hypothetical protein M1819_004725 [Sarea resinae]